ANGRTPRPIEQQRAPITPWVAHLASAYSPRMLPALFAALVSPGRALAARAQGIAASWWTILRDTLMALVPVLLAVVTMGAVWWYVTIHSQADAPTSAPTAATAS